jgi:hypothetical protein
MDNKQFDRTVYTVRSFLEVEVSHWGNLLKEHHVACMQEEASYSQRKAWFDCFNILRRELHLLAIPDELKESVYVVFEYELPRERGRRPDVLLLSGDNLFVLEFKGYSNESQAQIDQAKHYARDLKSYHERSHLLHVKPFLVLAAAENVLHKADEVTVVSGGRLHEAISPFMTAPFGCIQEWFKSEYSPLPSLLQSAQLLFKENRFPTTKRAHSAGIPETLAKLKAIVERSAQDRTHHLALITGVPGAGKTLVGLQFVFETYSQSDKQKAVFLSGNGPLVDVLQFSLKNRHFVQSVHGFLKHYAYSDQLPSEDVIIYDEAQRAWDSERVANSKREGSNSEPTDFVNIGSQKPHCLLIGLIGEGQEIYLGEESGLGLWHDALKQSSKNWVIHCPEKLNSVFPSLTVENEPAFNLTTSLRTHQAITLQKWVEALLEGRIEEAQTLFKNLISENYPIYITRNLEEAKAYLRGRYENEPGKTYGIVATSRNKVLNRFGVLNDYNSTKSFSVSQYYVDEGHKAYCRNLNSVVTEFGCQGLELDMPLMGWDADFVYDGEWRNMAPNNKARDADKLRKNSYRVLLTRGRDGMVIFVPQDNSLDSTYAVLVESGCMAL